MTTTIQTTNSIGTGTRFTFAASGDQFYVLDGVTVASTNDAIAMYGGWGNQSLFIDGTVMTGDAYAIYLTGANNVISIASTGVVRSGLTSNGNAGIDFNGGGGSIFNAGLVAAERAVGLLTNNGDNDITNTGTITGATAVFLGLFGTAGDRLTNTGTIIATDVNPNASVRYNHAVYAEGDNTLVTNGATGEIIAQAATGAGVSIGDGASYGGDGSRVTNHGSITSMQFWGVDFYNMKSTDIAELINFGTIEGATGAFRGNETGESVRNGGLMIGDVLLGAGADTFDGRGGTVQGDVLGGAGDDTFIVDDATLSLVENAAEGTDLVRSTVGWTLGANFETLELIGAGNIDGTGNGAANTITGNGGANVLSGRGGADTLDGGAGDDVVRGGRGGDEMHGGDGDDTLRGQRGNDELRGEDGNDWLRGAHGDDQLHGGDGDDTLVGGAGADTLTGNGDDDVFLFIRAEHSGTGANSDTITDFTVGEDLIDVSALAPGGLSYLGSGSFTGSGTAELRVTLVGSDSRVLIDLDGDGSADARILVDGVITLSEGDFVL